MTSRPNDFVRRVPDLAATIVARRPRTLSARSRGATWRILRRKKRAAEVAPPERTGVASRASASLVVQRQRSADERLTSQWQLADFSEALDPLGLPGAPRVQSGDSRRRVRGILLRLSYAGRLMTFNLAVAIIHLAVLRWIFLPIGG